MQDLQAVAQNLEQIAAAFKDGGLLFLRHELVHVDGHHQGGISLDEGHMQRKWEALQEYRSQMLRSRGYFEREFIFGTARMHGVQCGERYAEAFEVIRWRL